MPHVHVVYMAAVATWCQTRTSCAGLGSCEVVVSWYIERLQIEG